MLSLPAGTRIWLVAGVTDMRNRYRLTHDGASAIFASKGMPVMASID